MKKSSKPLPTGPSGTLLGGNASDLKNEPLKFLVKCRQQHGDFVPFRAALFPLIFICDPELIHEVLVTQAAHFSKDVALKNNREFFGNGLLSSEGEEWKRQRRLASPSFSPKRLESYSQVMTEKTLARIAQWKEGEVFDIQREMMRLTLSIALKTLFDAELDIENAELERALSEAQEMLSERLDNMLLLMLPEWVPFPTNVKLHQNIAIVDKVIYKLISERKGSADGRIDLLSTLISVRDDDGSGLTEKQIRDEVFTLFFAGHETTALTMTWTLYFLSQHPEVEQQLLSEISEVLKGKRPTAMDCFSLPYTEKVLKESMRLRPPVWAIGREAISDCLIGGYEVQKGTTILLSQWVNHHDERHFENPEKFDPERWTAAFSEKLPRFAYFPFGGGGRICIGNSFAMLESILLLVCIMQDFHLSMTNDQIVELVPAVTLRPKNGISMVAQRR